MSDIATLMKCALCGASFEWDGSPVSEMCCDACSDRIENENADLFAAIDELLSDPDVQAAIDADVEVQNEREKRHGR